MNWTEVTEYCDLGYEYYSTVDLLKTLQWSDSNGKYAMFFFPKFIEKQLGYSANVRELISDEPEGVGVLSFMNIKSIFYLDNIQFSKEGNIPVFKMVSKEQLKLKVY